MSRRRGVGATPCKCFVTTSVKRYICIRPAARTPSSIGRSNQLYETVSDERLPTGCHRHNRWKTNRRNTSCVCGERPSLSVSLRMGSEQVSVGVNARETVFSIVRRNASYVTTSTPLCTAGGLDDVHRATREPRDICTRHIALMAFRVAAKCFSSVTAAHMVSSERAAAEADRYPVFPCTCNCGRALSRRMTVADNYGV